MTNNDQPRTARHRRIRRVAIVALGVAVTGVLGATAAQASPTSGTAASSTITVDQDWRKLKGLQSERVPAYTCPADHPYLTKERYAPDFVTIPPGMEIFESPSYPNQLWPIGISITGWTLTPDPADPRLNLITGTKDGPLDSSATNWALHDVSYMARMHCTNDPAEAARR